MSHTSVDCCIKKGVISIKISRRIEESREGDFNGRETTTKDFFSLSSFLLNYPSAFGSSYMQEDSQHDVTQHVGAGEIETRLGPSYLLGATVSAAVAPINVIVQMIPSGVHPLPSLICPGLI